MDGDCTYMLKYTDDWNDKDDIYFPSYSKYPHYYYGFFEKKVA